MSARGWDAGAVCRATGGTVAAAVVEGRDVSRGEHIEGATGVEGVEGIWDGGNRRGEAIMGDIGGAAPRQ